MADQYLDGTVHRLVSELRVGDRVDLEGDIFADPNGGAFDSLSMGDSDHPEFAFEFETVAETLFEWHDTDPCICVTFESGFVCGFPPDHLIGVDAEQVR